MAASQPGGDLSQAASIRSVDDSARMTADTALPPPKRSRPVVLMIAALVTLGVVVAVVTGIIIVDKRERILTTETQELRSISVVMASEAEHSFESVELAEIALLERLQGSGLQTPDDFRQMMSGEANHQDLRSRERSLAQLDAITVIDENGTLINFSRYWPIPSVNVSDRDYFKALKSNPDLTTFISEPVQNRGDGSWTVYVARSARNNKGKFLGLILGAVKLSHFEDLYHSAAVHPHRSIAIYRRDGIMLARYPRDESLLGKPPGADLAFSPNGEISAEGFVTRLTGAADGDQIVAVHRVGHYPMVLTIADPMGSVLARWWRQTSSLVEVAILIECIVAGVAWLIIRQLRSEREVHEAHVAQALAEAARRDAEAALALSEERERAGREITQQHLLFSAALRNMTQGLAMFDRLDRLIVFNARMRELLDVPVIGIMPGMTVETILDKLTGRAALSPADANTFRHSIDRFRGEGRHAADMFELSTGRTLAATFALIPDDGWLMTLEDITDRRQSEVRIAHMAHHDSLTGLPNRVLYHQRLAEAVARSRRGERSAVLFLDLDHFKAVNDTLGHPVGDALLRAVTQRLRDEVRETDTIARLGGDEFAIVQANSDQPGDATTLAQRLIDTVSAPYELDGHQVVIGTSVGIALLPGDGETTEQLLKNADMALYRAKGDGRGRFRFFEPEMDAMMQARRALEMDLRRALSVGEFVLFYQPQMNLKTRKVVGFEALVRWNHPERGLVPPSEFVALAEEIGLIIPLGEWILRQACQDAVSWAGGQKVAVNLSPVQFGSRTLVSDVAAALRDTGLEPGRLELEITETVMLEDTDAVLATLHQLRDLGVEIAMDDFGTGYSSLSYLRRFPFDKVKIDRSFIEDLGQGGDCDAIVGAVTELCERLGMTTTAEGVETEDQLQRLYAGNCTEAQGYLFSKPRPANEVAALCHRLEQTEEGEARQAHSLMVGN